MMKGLTQMGVSQEGVKHKRDERVNTDGGKPGGG